MFFHRKIPEAKKKYTCTSNNTVLYYTGPLTHRFFLINIVNVLSLYYDFLNNIYFFLAYFIVIYIRYTICITYKTC